MRRSMTIILLLVCLQMVSGLTFAAINVGEKAPDFTLQTINNETISLSDYLGQVVVLHFWKSN